GGGDFWRLVGNSLLTFGGVGIHLDRILPVVNKVDKIELRHVRTIRETLGRYFKWLIPTSALSGFGLDTLRAMLFFKTPGYKIYKVYDPTARGLRVGDVVFVPAPAQWGLRTRDDKYF
ncbi:MAG: GTPase HflX, partial [Pyrobaculum sp.]